MSKTSAGSGIRVTGAPSKKHQILFVVLALLVMVGVSQVYGSGSQQTAEPSGQCSNPVTLTYATSLGTDSAYYKGAVALKDAAEKMSNGCLQIKIYANGVLGTDQDMTQGMQLGTIDMASPSTGAMGSIVPQATILDLPFLFESYEQAYKVLDGPIGQNEIYHLFDGAGFHPLGYWEIGFRDLTNNVRPVREPSDVKGLKLRTLPSKVQQQAWALVGAHPVAIDFTELYNALQTGVVDGEENPPNIILTGKLQEVQKYLSLTRHVYQVAPTSISDKSWAKLTPQLQEILKKAVAVSTAAERKASSGDLQAQLDQLRKDGMQIITDPDRAAFRAVMKPVWKLYLDQFPQNQKIIDDIQATK